MPRLRIASNIQYPGITGTAENGRRGIPRPWSGLYSRDTFFGSTRQSDQSTKIAWIFGESCLGKMRPQETKPSSIPPRPQFTRLFGTLPPWPEPVILAVTTLGSMGQMNNIFLAISSVNTAPIRHRGRLCTVQSMVAGVQQTYGAARNDLPYNSGAYVTSK
jgi:hypothetical protein